MINEQQSTRRLLAVVNETRHWMQAFIVHNHRMTWQVRNLVQQIFFGLRYMLLTWNAHAIQVEREIRRVHLVLIGMRDHTAQLEADERVGRVGRVMRRLFGRGVETAAGVPRIGSIPHVLNRLLEMPPIERLPLDMDVRERFRLPSVGLSSRVREIMTPGNSYEA